jgi:hypothetical protein
LAKKRSASHGRGIVRGTLISLEALAALITVGAVVIALVNHFNSDPVAALPGEGKRIIARAVGWDVNDLESVTPPPSRSGDFLEEVSVRRRARTQILALQQAIELHRLDQKARAIAALESLERESIEFSRSAGIPRCMQILPPAPQLIRRQGFEL